MAFGLRRPTVGVVTIDRDPFAQNVIFQECSKVDQDVLMVDLSLCLPVYHQLAQPTLVLLKADLIFRSGL